MGAGFFETPCMNILINRCMIMCDIAIFAGCSVIVGHYDNLPCAAPFKSLQGLVPLIIFYQQFHLRLQKLNETTNGSFA